MWKKGHYHYFPAEILCERKVITIIFPQTSIDLMTWVETFFFFCHDLQVVVRQSIGEIYKCRSITDPHYRLLNLESRYTLTEILPVNNRSWCTQRRNSLTKFWVKVGSCNHMLTSVKLHLNGQVPMSFTVPEACKISFNWTYHLVFLCRIVAKGLGFSLIFSPLC